MLYLNEKITQNLNQLKNCIITHTEKISDIEFVHCGYELAASLPENGWEKFNTETTFTTTDDHYWFKMKVETPETDENSVVCFRLNTGGDVQWLYTNPQGLLFLDGHPVQALDNFHTTVLLESGKKYEIACYYYTGNYAGTAKEKSYFIPELIVKNRLVEKLYYDVLVPFDASKLYENNKAKNDIMSCLEKALNKVLFYDIGSAAFYNRIKEAIDYLEEEFYEKVCGKSDLTVDLIGHTHIDIAWLWTYAQTEEKAQRSFATVLNLMKQYPDYNFTSSQAVLYHFVKKNSPELYEQIKERVKEGRWEVEGAMWVEPDMNLSSGESIIRQILFGKRFFKDEFGIDSKILWLPDTFGYSAALPQILKKCGVDKFVTSKISWNDENTIPHDTFMWQGIDGTEIFTQFMTCQDYNGYNYNKRGVTYNGEIKPSQILGTHARHHDKKLNDRTMITFGFGDGGGGPTAEMLETHLRTKRGIPGLPKTRMSTVAAHLDAVEKNFFKNSEELGRLPKWIGELYLEFHRGTYTSIARNKRNNRKAEFAVGKLEFLSSFLTAALGKEYNSEKLNEVWQLILLNQFHDVLPGSSIKEVYEDSDRHYAQIFADCDGMINSAIEILKGNINTKGGWLVINSTSAANKGAVKIDGKTAEVENIPSLGWKVIEKPDFSCNVTVNDKVIENKYYKVTLSDEGNIISLYDKRFEREIVRENKSFNELCVYEDFPYCYDNWEIQEYYKCKKWSLGEVVSMESVFDGTRAGIKICRKYMSSTFTQTIWLYSKLERIDFETWIDWHEHHQILKAVFPTDIHATKATYDVQFGNVERTNHQNTEWDEAKYEVCAHKWADVSDGGYGVSLLNDCKYGHSCIEGELTLTLIKCGTYPNPEADQGEHNFTYSIFPHEGDFRTGTVAEGYSLNQPFNCIYIGENKGTLAENFSFIKCDSDKIVIETVKRAQSGDGTVVRLYETANTQGNRNIEFGISVKKAYLCDMLENVQTELEVKDNTVCVPVKGYEIVTLKFLN